MKRLTLGLLALLPLLLSVTLPNPPTLAAFGDSLTSGRDWFGGLPDGWMALDHGTPGDECWNGIDDDLLGWMADPTGFSDPHDHDDAPVSEADVVVIFCGTNDVRKAGSVRCANDCQLSKDAIRSMADAARGAGYPVILVCAPPIMEDSYQAPDPILTIQQVNERLRDLCADMKSYAQGLEDVVVADIWPVFMALDDPAPPSAPNAPGGFDPGLGTAAPSWNTTRTNEPERIEHASEQVCSAFFDKQTGDPCDDAIHPADPNGRIPMGEVIAAAVLAFSPAVDGAIGSLLAVGLLASGIWAVGRSGGRASGTGPPSGVGPTR